MSRLDSLFEMAYTSRNTHQNRRGTLRFPPQLEMRPSFIAPNPVEFREALPNSTVFLTFHRHPEKLPTSPSQVEGTQGLLPQLEKDLEIPPSMCLEARFHCHDSKTMPCSASQLKWRLDIPEPQEGLPKFPIITQEKHHMSCNSSRKTTSFPHNHKIRPFFSCRA